MREFIVTIPSSPYFRSAFLCRSAHSFLGSPMDHLSEDEVDWRAGEEAANGNTSEPGGTTVQSVILDEPEGSHGNPGSVHPAASVGTTGRFEQGSLVTRSGFLMVTDGVVDVGQRAQW